MPTSTVEKPATNRTAVTRMSRLAFVSLSSASASTLAPARKQRYGAASGSTHGETKERRPAPHAAGKGNVGQGGTDAASTTVRQMARAADRPGEDESSTSSQRL